MANDARTQFIDGLRVTADHLQHVQDRLRESVRDLRRTVGLGKVAWGLHVTAAPGSLNVTPGVAFSPGGVRLNIDTPTNLPVPAGLGPWRVTLRAAEQDRASLRVGDQPTLISLITTAAVEPAGDPKPGEDALVIAQAQPGEGGGLVVTQDPAIFTVAGHHAHSGQFREDGEGRWYFDGPKIEGAAGPKGDKGDPGEKGDPGDKGAKGTKGDKGDTGDKGDAGAKGDKGDAGAKGDKGDVGVKGDKGDAGAKGDKGDVGAKGDKGAKGDPGEPGAGLDLNPTVIARVPWTHNASVTSGVAQSLLRQMRIDLSGTLHAETISTQPQVVQVWFLPNAPVATANVPASVQIIHGASKCDTNFITWASSEVPDRLKAMLVVGGQLLVRIHCGFLFDTEKRPVSASLRAVTPMENAAPTYGGIFESWFFVTAG